MTQRTMTLLVEITLAGFFAVAFIRACIPAGGAGKLSFSTLLQLPDRMERLRRSRWQWFSMVALLLAIRFQTGLPSILEAIVAIQFLLFIALPKRRGAVAGIRKP
jgi:hypothetical protein